MKKRIALSEEQLNKLKYEDFVAITIAEGGAMGDPGAIIIADKKLNYYYTHFGEIDSKILRNKIPFLDALELSFGDINGLGKDWVGLYTGYGNYLFVRPEYEASILDYINNKYNDTNIPPIANLYKHWPEALENIMSTK